MMREWERVGIVCDDDEWKIIKSQWCVFFLYDIFVAGEMMKSIMKEKE
jgi:hypothetical protein